MASQNANAVAITGGTIDGTTIGGTTPAPGTFATLIGGADQANYGQLTGGATTKAVEFKTLGADTNIALVLDSKGTGAIDLAAGSNGVNISNGGTVTAISRAGVGSGYTSPPTVAISAPTTAGGVQATATAFIGNTGTPSVVSGGTGYTVGDVLTIVGGTPVSVAATMTVTTVSAGVITAVSYTNFAPYTASTTNPVSVTGGTGTGATFAVAWGISGTFTITNAGSGYVEQPTVTLSLGGGSGATAYASVGGGTIIRSLGSTGTQSLDFYTPQGITANIPALRLRDSPSDSFPLFVSSAGGTSLVAQGSASAILYLSANGASSNSRISLGTNGTSQIEQMRVSHTANAVNYVQVTGAGAGNPPVISAQGATNPDLDLTLAPKGAGRLRFGTYTGTISAITGYIEIKDAGGTVRRLAVVA
jgi:hypothetical protein